MLSKLIIFSRKSSSFITKMTQIVAEDTKLAQRIQNHAINDGFSAEKEAKLRQKVNLDTTISNL